MHLKVPSASWWSFCLALNMLTLRLCRLCNLTWHFQYNWAINLNLSSSMNATGMSWSRTQFSNLWRHSTSTVNHLCIHRFPLQFGRCIAFPWNMNMILLCCVVCVYKATMTMQLLWKAWRYLIRYNEKQANIIIIRRYRTNSYPLMNTFGRGYQRFN